MRKIYRSTRDRILAGVCSGVAEYFGARVSTVRIGYVILCMLSFGIAVLGYIVAAIIIPLKTEQDMNYKPNEDIWGVEDIIKDSKEWETPPEKVEEPKNKGTIIGVAIIVIGLYLFAKQFLQWMNINISFPMALIIIGVAIVYKGRRQ